jgi:hypothetical protein
VGQSGGANLPVAYGVTPTRVNSWREFTAWFGGFETAYPPSLLHLAVYCFFSAGGTNATVIRSIRQDASGPVVASHTFNDSQTVAPRTVTDGVTTSTSATVTSATANFTTNDIGRTISGAGIPANSTIITINSGTSVVISANATATATAVSLTISGGGLPTLEVDAANPGAWASGTTQNPNGGLWIDILPGTIRDSHSNIISFTIQVKYQGNGPNNVVEHWPDLSMIPGSTNLGQANYAPDIINNPYTGSKYIHLVDKGNVPTPPAIRDYTWNPSTTTASQQLTGGSDGQPITFQDQLSALQQLDAYPEQPFVINMPGLITGSDISSVVGYAQTRGDSFVVIDCPPAYSPSAMVTFAQALSSSAQCAIYYPQVKISDPYSAVPGVTRMVAPGGFVVGQYIATDARRGVQKAPAGLGNSLLGAFGVETILTNTDQGNLTQANVNCIISVPGAGVVIWGARTLSPYLVTRYVPVERTLLYLATEMTAMTKFAVFEPNDWVLWNMITSVLSQFLTSFWQSGGLRGTSISEAFYVTCDSSVNTPQSIQQGIVNVEVGVSLQYPAEFVIISIGQWAGGQSVSVTTT